MDEGSPSPAIILVVVVLKVIYFPSVKECCETLILGVIERATFSLTDKRFPIFLDKMRNTKYISGHNNLLNQQLSTVCVDQIISCSIILWGPCGKIDPKIQMMLLFPLQTLCP